MDKCSSYKNSLSLLVCPICYLLPDTYVLYHILNFLEKQGLIDFVEEDEMIKTTKKLDSFMDWNLLNQNQFQRVLKVLGVEHE